MPFGDDENGPHTSTSIVHGGRKPKMYSCRPCDGTGILRGTYCSACGGTTMATARQGDRIRASWGPRSITRP
jgi:hypothetical protein